MSAIFGILRLDGLPASAAEVERMGAAMPHRSPDRRKIEMLGPVGLGHGLMRVTHEDWNDAQPLRDRAADLTLVADVRLDNREALAEALGISPEALAKLADSALILAAYKHWGEELVDHLIGDFAFALWDGGAQKLVLVRDHMGQRTLYYTRQPGFFAFATDIKALWAVEGVPQILSEAAVGRRLTLIPHPAGATLFDGILGLSGGAIGVVRPNGAFASRRYWQPRASLEHEGRDEAYYIAAYRSVLAEAVACRLRRNLKPAAILLSGGYDSAAIAGLAGEVLRPQGRKLIAVSSVLAEGREDEPGNARRWVEICRRHMPHLDVRYFVRRDETALTDLEEHFIATQLPMPGNHYANAALLKRAAEAGAQLVMDGHGGDYTLNPPGYGAQSYLLRTGHIWSFCRNVIGEARAKNISARGVITQAIRDLIPPSAVSLARRIRRGGAPFWSEAPIQAALAAELAANHIIAEKRQRARPRDRSRMRAHMLEMLTRQCGSATSGALLLPTARPLELASPFHDKRVVELALAIPESLYAKDGRWRYLARRALADVLPPEFQTRIWGGNDLIDPDSLEMISEIRDVLSGMAKELATTPHPARYIDFDRAGSGLHAVGPRAKREKLISLNAIVLGLYINWMDQRNTRNE